MSQTRGCLLDVVNEGTSFPAGFESLPFQGEALLPVIRYAGGCSGIDPAIVNAMPQLFIESHRGFQGVAMSGGTVTMAAQFDASTQETRMVPQGFTITYVPALLKQHYPQVIACSTTPRTDQMTLDSSYGGLILTDSLDRVDFRQDRAVIVQTDATEITEADWSKDVVPYLNLMQRWQEQGVKVAVVVVNGGGVTKKEIYLALERGIPVIAVKGSGRQTDAFIEAFEKGEAKVRDSHGDEAPVDASLVSIVSIDDPQGLRKVLVARGLIVEAA